MSSVKPGVQPGPVGRRVRELRAERGLSQRALASIVAVDKSEIYQLERGVVQEPKGTVLYRLADALSTTPDDLLGQTAPALSLDEERENLLRRIRARASFAQLRQFAEDLGTPA